MKLQIVNGKNFKNYIQISELETKDDFDKHEIIKQTVYRKEYKPFLQSFDKNISYSYLFNEVFVPAQFLQDIQNQIISLYNEPLIIENEDSLYDNDLTRDIFDNFINSLKVPSSISIDNEKYKYQRDSAFLALKNKIARIEIATSGGKTFITYLWCRYNIFHNRLKNKDYSNQKILIIVPSKLLVQQLQKDFEQYQLLESDKIIIETMFAGSKKIIDADIVCGTYQSLSNYDEEYFNDFRFVICDEVHRSKAYSIRNEIYNKIKNAEYFFGMSGTFPKYNTLDYLHIVSMFGPLVYKKNLKSLIDDGVASPIKLHIIKLNYEDKEFSKCLIDNNISGTKKYHVEKEYFQGLSNRTDFACKLIKSYNANSLILVDTVEYCNVLKTYIDDFCSKNNLQRTVEIIHGNISNRSDIIEEMKNTENNFILIGTYGTMSTGVSIPNMEAVYFLDGGKSDIRIRQSLGRGIRLSPKTGKTHCKVFDFYDNMPRSSFKNHANERLKIYKEQGLDFKIHEVLVDNKTYSEEFITTLDI